MGLSVATERNGRLFHDDAKGRFYFNIHDDYVRDNKTYLYKCMNCKGWIYPDEEYNLQFISRIGAVKWHKLCSHTA